MDQVNLDHGYVGERSMRNPVEDSMNPCYESANLGTSFLQVHADRPDLPRRQIDATPSIGALRLVNGLESPDRRSVGGISRRRQRRTTTRELQASSDHYRTDIRLDRTRIVSTVEEIIETGDQPA